MDTIFADLLRSLNKDPKNPANALRLYHHLLREGGSFPSSIYIIVDEINYTGEWDIEPVINIFYDDKEVDKYVKTSVSLIESKITEIKSPYIDDIVEDSTEAIREIEKYLAEKNFKEVFKSLNFLVSVIFDSDARIQFFDDVILNPTKT